MSNNELTPEEIRSSIELFQTIIDQVKNACAVFKQPMPEEFKPIINLFQDLIDKGHFTKSELEEATRKMEQLGLNGLTNTEGQQN